MVGDIHPEIVLTGEMVLSQLFGISCSSLGQSLVLLFYIPIILTVVSNLQSRQS